MPRKSKSPSDAPGAAASEPTPPEPSVVAPGEMRKVAKKSSGRKTAAKKSTASRTKRKAEEPGDAPKERREPSDDEIRLRAYFIAEWRTQMGISGGESDDWVEARRQLEAELGG